MTYGVGLTRVSNLFFCCFVGFKFSLSFMRWLVDGQVTISTDASAK